LGYLIFQILIFLLLAALLGFFIGWLLRGARFKTELQDIDARWRAKLSDVETERDRFASELTQAKEARVKSEASAAEAKHLADTHEKSLQQLRSDHDTKLGLLGNVEKRVGGLEADLSSRDKELKAAKEALTRQGGGGGGGDADRLGRELTAVQERRTALERELQQAKEANGACKRRVESLEAEVASLKSGSGGASGGSGSGGGALGLMSSGDSRSTGGAGGSGGAGGPGGVASSSTGGGAASGSGGGALGLTGSSGAGTGSSASTGDDDDNEGVRPSALSGPDGGSADDLKKISGVGPKLEKTLNGLGIYHFAQIAAFTPDNVAWVDRHLRFKGRIERENWIEQAKVLATGGETEFSRRS